MSVIPSYHTVHLCVDMHRMFAECTEWQTTWSHKILPQVLPLTERYPEQTVFTRFIPDKKSDQDHGTWKTYYEHWDCLTLAKLVNGLVDLIPELASFTPPAEVIDKHVYGPWVETELQSVFHRGELIR